MIVFRCLLCNLGHLSAEVLRCPHCGAENFVAEYGTQPEPEPPLVITQAINFNNEHAKSTAEANREASDSRASLNEPSESTAKGFAISYEAYSYEVHRANVEYGGLEDAGTDNFNGSCIFLEKEQHSPIFTQYRIVNERLSPETENAVVYDQSLSIQDNDSCNPSNFKCLPEPASTPTAETQHPIIFPSQPQSANDNSQSFKNRMVQKDNTTESSQIESKDVKTDYTALPRVESQISVLKSYPEITKGELTFTRDERINPSEDMSIKILNSSNPNIQSPDLEGIDKGSQQEAHSLKHQASMKGQEKAFALPIKVHSRKSFRCEKCLNAFNTTLALNLHVQKECDPKPYECDDCGKKFCEQGQLKSHQKVHTEETTFKCDQCDYSSNWKANLIRHTETVH